MQQSVTVCCRIRPTPLVLLDPKTTGSSTTSLHCKCLTLIASNGKKSLYLYPCIRPGQLLRHKLNQSIGLSQLLRLKLYLCIRLNQLLRRKLNLCIRPSQLHRLKLYLCIRLNQLLRRKLNLCIRPGQLHRLKLYLSIGPTLLRGLRQVYSS